MTLLALEHVGKRQGTGAHEHVVLDDVCLELVSGELMMILGARRSGRSTLLRIAAGLERPDRGVVRFLGEDVSARAIDAMAGHVAFCRKALGPNAAATVLDCLIESLIVRGASASQARAQSRRALARTDASQCASLRVGTLDANELTRVAIARAIASTPKLLVLDDPTLGLDRLERDPLLVLLRSLADEGMAVLGSAERASGLALADRALALSGGTLRGELSPQLAPVISMRRSA